jgi:hypothetical protein
VHTQQTEAADQYDWEEQHFIAVGVSHCVEKEVRYYILDTCLKLTVRLCL